MIAWSRRGTFSIWHAGCALGQGSLDTGGWGALFGQSKVLEQEGALAWSLAPAPCLRASAFPVS